MSNIQLYRVACPIFSIFSFFDFEDKIKTELNT